MSKEKKEIVITNNSGIMFPKVDDIHGNVLILGNFNSICGDVFWKGVGTGSINMEKWDTVQENNLSVIVHTIKSIYYNNTILGIIASKDTIAYFQRLVYTLLDYGFGFDKELTDKDKKHIFKNIRVVNIDGLYEAAYKIYEGATDRTNESGRKTTDDIVKNKIFKKLERMKFDTIIQNPPYNKSLHLDFLEKGLDLLSENGKMVIIEPATWLINVRKNGKGKKYNEIKKRIEGHVENVVIENLNKDFGTGLYTPFATTTIDMSKTFDTIELIVCGEHRMVKSIYDCNLIGKYETIWGIFEKCKKFGDMMENHTTKEAKEGDVWYAKYHELTTRGGLGLTACVNGAGMILENAFSNPIYYVNGYVIDMFHCGYSTIENSIKKTPHFAVQRGGAVGSHKLSDKIADNIYGTRQELENWKHFIFNNKLPLFLNIVLTIDQHNNSKPYLPWLVDKQYTDEEINQMFGFTDEEIALIDRTIKKYERNSPWFKRYMCGPDSVSDEEVNNFIKSIN